MRKVSFILVSKKTSLKAKVRQSATMIGNWFVDWFTCIEIATVMIGNDMFESLGRYTK